MKGELKKGELSKDDLAKVYREFSRTKYNKYRHQFPRMRESQLVSKIIKEWEALNTQEKETLFQNLSAEKLGNKSESSERSPSPGSSKSKKQKKSQGQIQTGVIQKHSSSGTPSKKASVRVFVRSSSSKKEKDQKSESSDFARDAVKKDFEISDSVSKQLGIKVVGSKKKKIVKDTHQPKTDYLKFFKFYYDKLSKEHPRWLAGQISTIIKLLWKKKQVTDKNAAKVTLRTPKERRRMSGRMTFRRNYNYSSIEAFERWKQLPVESKGYWKLKGEGMKSGQRKVFASLVRFMKISRKNSAQGLASSGKAFGFMSRTIAA